jgi:hypothetical protein
MFIGHFAVAFAAKRTAPELSLGTLFLAAQLADLVWPTLVLLGVEAFEIKPGATAVTPLDFIHYPWSHSLVALVGWGFLLAIVWLLVRRGTPWAALVIIGTVLSHWVLDVISHRPDMPITVGGAARFGLGLWNSLPATLAVEGILFVLCVALYARATKPLDGIGRWGLWSLVAVLAIAYHDGGGVDGAGDVAAGRLGLLGRPASGADSAQRAYRQGNLIRGQSPIFLSPAA